MRLNFMRDTPNPRAENALSWIVLLFSVAAVILSSVFPVSRKSAAVFAPVGRRDDPAVSWQGDTPRIDINRADMSLLQELPGIGERRAEAIIRYREENGAFASVDELLNVPKISKKVLEGIEEKIRVTDDPD